MDWLISIILTLMLIKQYYSLPLGCSYNGTFYNDGDSLKAKDPCLSCSCQSGALVCNLQVCGKPPDPLPKNCFLVHKDNECCPHMFCEENNNDDNGIELRTAFKPKKTIESNDCTINGTIFAEGSAVGSPHLCEYCYCLKGEIKCLKPRCSQNFKDCKPIFHESFCCPTHYDCRISNDSKTILNNYGCKRNGIYFLEGDMVPPANNSMCESCYCMKSEIICSPITCQIEPDLKDCQPLNTKDQCCPTAFNCERTKLKNFMNSTSNFSKTEDNSKTDNQKKITKTTKPLNLSFQNESKPFVELMTTEKKLVAEISTVKFEMEPTKKFITTKVEKNENNFNLSAITDWQSYNKKVETIKKTTVPKKNIISTSPFPQTTSNVITEENFRKNLEKLDVRNKAKLSEIDLNYEEFFRNTSLHSDDYDNYDYNEPKLPPSLPNLVIFPFVAADAVVKDKTNVLESNNIKKIDVSPGYYNSYSYPTQAQGKCFWDGKEICHGETLPETEECLTCACQHGEIICQEIICKSIEPGCINIPKKGSCCGTTICDLGTSENIATNDFSIFGSEHSVKLSNTFEEIIKTEVAPDLSQFSDLPDSSLHSHTIKPVTVTYKNIVVDYYPEFSITSLRDKINLTTDKNLLPESDFNSNISTDVTLYTSTLLNTSKKISTEENSSKSNNSLASTTTKASFLSELLLSWLKENYISTTTVPTAPSKFQYSSKIKTDFDATKQNIKNDAGTEKIKELSGNKKANTPKPNFSDHSSTQKKFGIYNASTFETAQKTHHPLKIDSPSFKDQHNQLLNSENKEDSKKNKKTQENTHKKSTQAEGSINNFTTILKLAGCNIYGRMYRVGKIITELSGPCSECICTNLGVQCNSLPC